MIKLIASDMDGTLLNEESRISDKVMEALKLAKQKGVLFFLATGREYDLVEPLMKEYDLHCGQILMNGSEVRDEQGNIKETINLNKSVISDIVSISEEYGLYNEVFTDRGMFTTMEKEAYFEANAYRFHGFRPDLSLETCREFIMGMDRYKEHTCITNMEEFLNSDIEIRKFSCFHSDLNQVEKARIKIKENINGIAVLSFFADNIEITDEKAQKGLILKKLIKQLNIKSSEVAVMGDSFNDISLFQEFEHSFAVDNAISEIKQLAKYIVPSNKQDGAAVAVHKALTIA
jgi:Cof subfamily protein (haloacid dehalogenase superfamily)